MDREVVLKSYLENAELLKKRNTENIEKFRKGDFVIEFPLKKPRKITVEDEMGETSFEVDFSENGKKFTA